MRENQKGVAGIVFVLIIIALIGVIGYLIIQKNQTSSTVGPSQPVSTQSSTTKSQDLKSEPKQIKIQESVEAKDYYKLNNIEIEDGALVLNVSYSGGCEQHFFDLVWKGGFYESIPPQADLFLVHDANGDGCEALITKSLRFDLKIFDTEEQLILRIVDFDQERQRINYTN